MSLEPAARLDAIETGHHDVHHHEVWLERGDLDQSIDRVFTEIIEDHPDVRFVLGAGDMPTFESIFTRIVNLTWNQRCGALTLPFFPAFGHAEVAETASVEWFAMYAATNWMDAPETSALALQLPDIGGFRRGPLGVQRPDGVHPLPPGSVYSFDYAGAHFVVTNTYDDILPSARETAPAGVIPRGRAPMISSHELDEIEKPFDRIDKNCDDCIEIEEFANLLL